MDDEPKFDPPLTPEQQAQASALSDSELTEIDEAILRNTDTNWRKVARVVGSTMLNLEGKHKGLPDVFYAQRIKSLVKGGLLVSQGNLNRMRQSEVKRLKIENDKTS
ncbi:DUF3658 domain-containing protein [Neptunomonas sp.]|uniref:DUF3658 domain-containing protein n=1 Tax=Neptunomonas sp. TaxID=1971898 RepID=UPI0035688D53